MRARNVQAEQFMMIVGVNRSLSNLLLILAILGQTQVAAFGKG